MKKLDFCIGDCHICTFSKKYCNDLCRKTINQPTWINSLLLSAKEKSNLREQIDKLSFLLESLAQLSDLGFIDSPIYRLVQSFNDGSWRIVTEIITDISLSKEKGWVLSAVDSKGEKMSYLIPKALDVRTIFLSFKDAEREKAAREAKLPSALTKDTIIDRLFKGTLIGSTVYWISDETYDIVSGEITEFLTDQNGICHLTIKSGDSYFTEYDNACYFPGFYFSVDPLEEELKKGLL